MTVIVRARTVEIAATTIMMVAITISAIICDDHSLNKNFLLR